jgi:hypothetical protein
VFVSALNFGPFDNGHIMVGLTNGELLAFDLLTLERLENTMVFPELSPVTGIAFDPTHTIFVSAQNGSVVSLSPLNRAKNYLYVDMGDQIFCTLEVSRRKQLQEHQVGFHHLQTQSGVCCV